MHRTPTEVADLLRAVSETEDGWLHLSEPADGCFEVADPDGCAATITIEQHWVDVRAVRPAASVARTLGGYRSGRSLIRVDLSDNVPVVATVRGRVYLDGFTLHAFMSTVDDVLALAGPAPPSPNTVPEESETELSAEHLESPEAPVDAAPPEDVSVVADERQEPSTVPTPIATVDATLVSPESAAALPLDAMSTVASAGEPEASSPITPSDPALETTPPVAAAPPPDATPIAPPYTSSVGATVQIPRMRSPESPPPAMPPPSEPAPGAETAGPTTCHRCGAEVQPGERFCISCGTPQASAASAPVSSVQQTVVRRSEPDTVIWRRPQPGDNPCARCGEVNPENNRYCQSCGATLRNH